jgi:hypothetical protein
VKDEETQARKVAFATSDYGGTKCVCTALVRMALKLHNWIGRDENKETKP